MNNISSNEFMEVMDSIGKEYAELSRTKKTGLLYSGGIDSTALLLSLMNSDADISLVHWCFFDPPTSYGIFCKEMTIDMCRRFSIPFCFISNPYGDDFKKGFKLKNGFQLVAQHGFHDLIYGEGIDSIFINYYKGYIKSDGSSRNWGHGEVFRAFHPFLEMFSSYVPNRLAIYGLENNFTPDMKVFVDAKQDAKSADVVLHYYSIHPLMLDFINDYREDVGDIFFRKRLIELYVKKKLGRSFNSVVREVCRKNKDMIDSSMRRFFSYIENRKEDEETEEDVEINASC